MEKIKKQNYIFTILALLCIAIFCFAITPKTLQNDTYYTIKIGEYIYENGISNLDTDIYSWHDLPYTYPHWLYDLGTYVVFHFFSWTGIYVTTAILSICLGFSIFYISDRFSKNKVVSFLITLGAMYMLRTFIAARAQLLTFILFAWTVYFIEKYLDTHKKRYALFLIVIPLIIANVHCAVFPFYFVLYLPYIGEYLVAVFMDWELYLRIRILICNIIAKVSKNEKKKEYAKKYKLDLQQEIKNKIQKRQERRKNPYKIRVRKNHFTIALIIVMIIAALTGFINPTGTGAYTYIIKTMKGNTTSLINEHLPLTLIENIEFVFAIVLFLAILIFTDTKIKLSDLFMLCGLTYLSFKMRRQVSMFAIFCGYILAKLIADFLNKYDKKLEESVIDVGSTFIGGLLIFAIVFYISYDLYKPIKDNHYIDENAYPVAASAWIKENLDLNTLKLYNEYNYGSYLLFEGIPVFIDSRCDLYTPEFNGNSKENIEGRDIFSDALNIAGISVNYNTKFEEYGVNYIISFSNSKLCMLLEEDSKYTKKYDDNIFRIYERIK